MSQAPTMPRPPARTAPSTRAMTGLGSSTIVAQQAEHPSRPRLGTALGRLLLEVGAGTEHRAGVGQDHGADGVVGRRTRRCSVSSVTSWADSALRLAGESRVTSRSRARRRSWTSASVRLRQAEAELGDEVEDHLPADRRDARRPAHRGARLPSPYSCASPLPPSVWTAWSTQAMDASAAAYLAMLAASPAPMSSPLS